MRNMAYRCEFKYGKGGKAYLSAILDYGDRSIVSFVVSFSKNKALVLETFNVFCKYFFHKVASCISPPIAVGK